MKLISMLKSKDGRSLERTKAYHSLLFGRNEKGLGDVDLFIMTAKLTQKAAHGSCEPYQTRSELQKERR